MVPLLCYKKYSTAVTTHGHIANNYQKIMNVETRPHKASLGDLAKLPSDPF